MYHINPETGRPNKCYAQSRPCPFGGVEKHYESKEAAQQAFEGSMKDQLVQTVKKPEIDQVSERVHDYPADCSVEVENAISKANRRLARFGIEEQFAYEVDYYVQETKDNFGLKKYEERMKVTIKNPSISYGGHKFLAVMTKEEAGFIMRTAQDAELNGWTPKDQVCDHCGQNRPRSKTYIVQDPDGNRLQIGSSCVQGYLGVQPQGLWAIGDDPVSRVSSERNENSSYVQPTEFSLGLALAISDNGKNFVTRNMAMEYGTESTADQINNVLHGESKDPKVNAYKKEMVEKAHELVESGEAKKLQTQLSELDGGNDWANNVKTLAKGEWVKPKNVAILASGIIAVRKREEREKAARERVKSVGFFGKVEDKLVSKKSKIESIRGFPGINAYTGKNEVRNRVIFRDEDGKMGVWWTTKPMESDLEGKDIEFTSGIIKDHKNYKGDDQTILTRVKMKTLEDK